MSGKSKMLWVLVAAVGVVLSGPLMSRVEQAKYTLVKTEGNIEIRDYAANIVAETRVQGERGEAMVDGFKRIADYIFGNNVSNVTAHAAQQKSQRIAMTAPVIQKTIDDSDNSWAVRFVMPAEYTLETLPKPKNADVYIKAIPETRFAVIQFSGVGSDERLKKETELLRAYMTANHLQEISSPNYAFYNPPWTLPAWRRNEVMIQVEQ